jgi:hypothetical protein
LRERLIPFQDKGKTAIGGTAAGPGRTNVGEQIADGRAGLRYSQHVRKKQNDDKD